MSLPQEAECHTQCIPVPGEPGGNPPHDAWRIEAVSLELLERRKVAIMEADGVAVSEFLKPVQNRATGLWVAYGYTMDRHPQE